MPILRRNGQVVPNAADLTPIALSELAQRVVHEPVPTGAWVAAVTDCPAIAGMVAYEVPLGDDEVVAIHLGAAVLQPVVRDDVGRALGFAHVSIDTIRWDARRPDSQQRSG